MLQLIAHLRDIRNGKGETARSLDAYVWLAMHHPRTLLANLPEMVKVGICSMHVSLIITFHACPSQDQLPCMSI